LADEKAKLVKRSEI